MTKTLLTIQTDSVSYDAGNKTINVVFSPTNLILVGEITHSAEISIVGTTPEQAILDYEATARNEILKNLPSQYAEIFE